MPRDPEKVRRRLQDTALTLFETRGYEQTTAADIAEAAGVTSRTFFRHFPDKREVLFGGDEIFIHALERAVFVASPSLNAWQTLLYAFKAVEPLLVENRSFSEPRQRIVAGSPALQERADTKSRAVVNALSTALCKRGVPQRSAGLVAQVGMAAMSVAVTDWFADPSRNFSLYVENAFRETGALSSPGTTP